MTNEEIRLGLQVKIQSLIDDSTYDPGAQWLTDVNATLDACYDGPGSIPVGPPPG